MTKYKVCKSCNKQLQIVQDIKKCTNLGCIDYNKQVGAKVVRKKNVEEEE